jgi:cytidine deaminase
MSYRYDPRIVKLAIKKAMQSSCHYKISAIGFNRKNEIIYKATNVHRFTRKGGGIHAEMRVMRKAGPSLSWILIVRTNNRGDILPIDPCETCAQKASELGIKIITIPITIEI